MARLKSEENGSKKKIVSLADLALNPDDMTDNSVHYTSSGNRKVMARVVDAVTAAAGKEAMAKVQVADKPYGG